jgi:hypothetical protein
MGKKKSIAQIPLGGALVQRTPVNTHVEIPSPKLINYVNSITGENSGALGRANYALADAGMRQGDMTARQVAERFRMPLETSGSGLYANPHMGHGLYANPPPGGHGLYASGGALLKHHRHKKHSHAGEEISEKNKMRSNRREKGSVGINGRLIHQPQALTPQPYSVNFAWGNTLPPFYQKFNRG